MQAPRLPCPRPAWAADPAGEAVARAPREPKGIPRGVRRDRPRKRPSGTSWGRGLLGQNWGIILEVMSRGPPPISIRIQEGGVTVKAGLGDHVRRPRHRGWGWGGDGGAWTWRDEVARQPGSAPEVAKSGARQRIYGTLGVPEALSPAAGPRAPALQAELCFGWALPAAIPRSRDP